MRRSSRERPTRTSELLIHLAEQIDTPRVSIRYIVDALGDRGLGVLIAVFAAPNILPSVVPMGSAVFGAAVMIFCIHLVFGVRHLVLPEFIARRSMSTDSFRAWAPRLARALSWFERLLKPRLPGITHAAPERIVGLIGIVLAIASSVPLPLVDTLPAVGLTMMGLGLIERDGHAILAGVAIGALGVLVVALMLFGFATGIEYLTRAA